MQLFLNVILIIKINVVAYIIDTKVLGVYAYIYFNPKAESSTFRTSSLLSHFRELLQIP